MNNLQLRNVETVLRQTQQNRTGAVAGESGFVADVMRGVRRAGAYGGLPVFRFRPERAVWRLAWAAAAVAVIALAIGVTALPSASELASDYWGDTTNVGAVLASL